MGVCGRTALSVNEGPLNGCGIFSSWLKTVTVCFAGMTPAFTAAPVDITVTDGAVATFTCQVSGAPKPAIMWKRGKASAKWCLIWAVLAFVIHWWTRHKSHLSFVPKPIELPSCLLPTLERLIYYLLYLGSKPFAAIYIGRNSTCCLCRGHLTHNWVHLSLMLASEWHESTLHTWILAKSYIFNSTEWFVSMFFCTK